MKADKRDQHLRENQWEKEWERQTGKGLTLL